MHRFVTRETRRDSKKSRVKLIYIITPVLILIFYLLIGSVSKTTIDKQEESLRNAINKNVMHCYAVEGYYPPSLDYLKEHYGLTYNEDLFVVDYRPIGSNIRPEFTILRQLR